MQSSEHEPSDWNPFHVTQWPRLIADPEQHGNGDPKQDEFIYILEGRSTLIGNRGETRLAPGMCLGFNSGTGDALLKASIRRERQRGFALSIAQTALSEDRSP